LDSDPSIVFCEDFEDPSYDDGTGDGWAAVYPGGNNDCNDYGTYAISGEGPIGDWKCFNIVTNAKCDVSGENECVFEDTYSLGEKYDQGLTHGKFGFKGFAATQDFGITYAVKFSENFQRLGSPGYKPTETHVESQSIHWGQNEDSWFDAATWKLAPGYSESDVTMEKRKDDHNWNTKLFYTGSGSSTTYDIASVNITKGKIWATNAKVVAWAPFAEDFPGGDFSWPLGTWGCMATKVTGLGTSNTAIQQWWQGPSDGDQTLVISFSGLDTTGLMPGGREFNGFNFNNYFNGKNQCGYGGTGGSPPNCTYDSVTRAYRYADNYVVTNGEPISCNEIGMSGTPVVPTATTTQGVNFGQGVNVN